ncbi:PREDICTED: probable serine/threonine-protein kinase drkD [Amphimedon queenslandica]|uniref:Protein kinase domain-containing protein n=1 Tax=Amphimedon queenslandica TaxID=400682 RepID=A0AAN0JWD5_AMPQE|nr:PREDICTED: probable serine/threonine-protein kinase drkD [Amphimedon queenslandica]|eukprot:XP_019861384.1 PREDICTED: probable serine/threonine-protein kinase drkD [Amphimedon queenslandica]
MAFEAPGYQPVKRNGHSTVRVGDYLYMWGGSQPGLPEVHNNEMKKSMCSVMEVCDLRTGRWEQKPTTGNPPLGVKGYAAAAIGREIFYFGGWCNHGNCRHNSLYSFNVDTFHWKELSPTTSRRGPMMKANCDMIAIKVNGKDYLVVTGGYGSSNNTPKQPGAQYSGEGLLSSNQRCNEIHFYKLSTGSVQWPKGRPAHSSVLITTSSGPHLLVVGGDSTYDIWIFDINNKSWKELVNIPDIVTKRWNHSLSVWSVTPITNWIIVFGGYTPYNNTAVIELRYTSNNDWSTSIIPLSHYQEKLQERRREWEACQPIQPENRREIDRLRRVLQERERELEEERREKEQVRNRLQQQLQGRERQLQQAQQQGQDGERQAREQILDLRQQLQEKERQVRQAQQEGQEIERQAREQEQDLQRQLQEKGRQLQQAQQEGQEIERQAREQEQDLRRQLQEKDRQVQQAQQEGQEIERQAREREQDLQRQLQEKDRQVQQAQQKGQEREMQIQEGREREQDLQQAEQLQSREEESQEREQQLQRQAEGDQQKEQDLQRQLQEKKRQLEEREREFQERERQLEEQIQVAESSWVVNRREITMTEVVLGKGGWGEVKVAGFRSVKVAAKCLYDVIISPYNIGIFSREMNIASKIRHPNLLQFIGATTEGNPIILTELMPTSLRKELETGGVAYPAILSISLDVGCALNYLHLFKPHPILHRDVSSANVLLQLMGGGGYGYGWRAKVSDHGTVCLQSLTSTRNPGNLVYSAPESFNPREHSPAMDVFSYGVLLLEMVVCQFQDVEKRVAQIKAIKRPTLKNLIERCLIENYKDRPTMSDIIMTMIAFRGLSLDKVQLS